MERFTSACVRLILTGTIALVTTGIELASAGPVSEPAGNSERNAVPAGSLHMPNRDRRLSSTTVLHAELAVAKAPELAKALRLLKGDASLAALIKAHRIGELSDAGHDRESDLAVDIPDAARRVVVIRNHRRIFVKTNTLQLPSAILRLRADGTDPIKYAPPARRPTAAVQPFPLRRGVTTKATTSLKPTFRNRVFTGAQLKYVASQQSVSNEQSLISSGELLASMVKTAAGLVPPPAPEPVALPALAVAPNTPSIAPAPDGITHTISDAIDYPLALSAGAPTQFFTGVSPLPFVTGTNNIDFVVPAYIKYEDANAGVQLGAEPSAVKLQALQIDVTGQPVLDSTDPSGMAWSDFPGSPIAVSPAVGTAYNCPYGEADYCPVMTGSVWTIDLSFNPNVSYTNAQGNKTQPGVTFLEDLGSGDPQGEVPTSQSANNAMTISAYMQNVSTPVRFVVADCTFTDCTTPSGLSAALDIHGTETPAVTSPFVIVDEPTAFAQLKVQPLYILFQPPGTQSTSTYTTSQTIYTSYTVGASKSSTQTQSQATANSWTFKASGGDPKISIPFVGDIGISVNYSDSNMWDTTTSDTSSSMASTQDTNVLASTLQQGLSIGPDPYSDPQHMDPFWNDTFYMLVHPQYAIWNLLSASNGGNLGSLQFQLIAAGTTPLIEPVKALDDCANGLSVIPLPGPVADQLGAADCIDLLQQDPFYVNGQHFLSNNTPPNNNSVWGSFVLTGLDGGTNQWTPTNKLVVNSSSNTQEVVSTASSAASSVAGNTNSLGVSVVSPFFSTSFTNTVSSSTSYGTSSSSGALNIKTVNQSVATSNAVILWTTLPPVATSIFADNRFGTLMFPSVPPQLSSICLAPGACHAPTNPATTQVLSRGTAITIEGIGLTDTTSVMFGALSAKFSLSGDDLLTIDVPNPPAGTVGPYSSVMVIAGEGFSLSAFPAVIQ